MSATLAQLKDIHLKNVIRAHSSGDDLLVSYMEELEKEQQAHEQTKAKVKELEEENEQMKARIKALEEQVEMLKSTQTVTNNYSGNAVHYDCKTTIQTLTPAPAPLKAID